MDTSVVIHVSNEIVTTVSLILNAAFGVVSAILPLIAKIKSLKKR